MQTIKVTNIAGEEIEVNKYDYYFCDNCDRGLGFAEEYFKYKGLCTTCFKDEDCDHGHMNAVWDGICADCGLKVESNVSH
jgi:hypothetical protein